jgi:hypothetical protein
VKAGSGKSEVCHAKRFSQEGDRPISLAAHKGHFLLTLSKDVGKQEFSGKVRAATNVAATDFTSISTGRVKSCAEEIDRFFDFQHLKICEHVDVSYNFCISRVP